MPDLIRHASWRGYTLALLAVLIAASALPEMRFGVGGLSVHPYMFPAGALFTYELFRGHLVRFPAALGVALAVFVFMYAAATLSGPRVFNQGLNEVIKVSASMVVVVLSAILIRTQRDLMWGMLGMVVAGALISFRGVIELDSRTGANALAGIANENATSLYTLPPLLIAAIALREFRLPYWVATVMALSSILICANTFLSANRSGWLGVALIAALLMLTSIRKSRAMFMVGALAIPTVVLLSQFDTRAFEDSVAYTQGQRGSEANELRLKLITESIEIGLGHPLLGVSPVQLPSELGQQMGFVKAVYTHNVFSHVFGGAGLFAFSALLWAGWQLCARSSVRACSTVEQRLIDPERAQTALRIMVALWAVRGMFTHEILYSPAFCVGLGMLIGMGSLAGVWGRPRAWGPADVQA